MTKTRRFFFTLTSSSVLALALGAGPVFADSWGSSCGGSSGGWSHHMHHGGDSSGGGFLLYLLHAVQQYAGAYPKGSTPLGSGH